MKPLAHRNGANANSATAGSKRSRDSRWRRRFLAIGFAALLASGVGMASTMDMHLSASIFTTMLANIK
jgi:hypothetical protein